MPAADSSFLIVLSDKCQTISDYVHYFVRCSINFDTGTIWENRFFHFIRMYYSNFIFAINMNSIIYVIKIIINL